jgi:hypothetical protein
LGQALDDGGLADAGLAADEGQPSRTLRGRLEKDGGAFHQIHQRPLPEGELPPVVRRPPIMDMWP